MKKILVMILVLFMMPIMVMAAEEDENTTTSTTTTTSNIEKSPDTGVEDYFITLGAVSVSLGAVLYILNKKNVFQEI